MAAAVTRPGVRKNGADLSVKQTRGLQSRVSNPRTVIRDHKKSESDCGFTESGAFARGAHSASSGALPSPSEAGCNVH